MSRHHEQKERISAPEITTLLIPDMTEPDLPHVPILWGAFNPDLFLLNRERLLGLRNKFFLTHEQKATLNLLSYQKVASVMRFFWRFNQWTEVTDNLITELGLSDNNELLQDLDSDGAADFIR